MNGMKSIRGEKLKTKAEKIMMEHAGKIIPVGDSIGIYFLLKGSEIVYVGQSRTVYQRIETHKTDGTKEFDKACFFECSVEELDDIERTLIRAFGPKYNKTHKLFSTFIPYDERSPRDLKLAASLARRIAEGRFNKNTVKALKSFRFTIAE
jgi:hypothetical protein